MTMFLNRSNDASHSVHPTSSTPPTERQACPTQSLVVKRKPANGRKNSTTEHDWWPKRSPSSLFRMRSSSLLVLGLLHHGMRTAGAFPVVAPMLGTTRTPSASSIAGTVILTNRDHHCARSLARRNHQTDTEESANVDGTSNRKKSNINKPGWRRRVLSRLRRKRGSLEAVATADETPKSRTAVDQFILENFERLSPEQLFSTLENSHYVLDSTADSTLSPFFESPIELPIVQSNSTTETFHGLEQEHEDDNILLDCVVPSSVIGETSSFEGGPPLRKYIRNWFQALLTNCFCEWAAEEPVNLQVRCSPSGNVFSQLLRGQLNCNARADFERLVFNFIRLSGGSIEGSRLALNLLAFTVDRSKELKDKDSDSTGDNKTTKSPGRLGFVESKKMLPRYQTQFDLHANDCIMTQEDLFESSCVRNGLQNLVKRILRQRRIQTTSVVIEGIAIQNGKVCVKGEANVKGVIPTRILFEVRSGLDFKNRGHVLTFPGLELSVSPDVGFFVPISGVELDLGHNARIRECTLDSVKQQLRVAASVTITPLHTLKLGEAYTQSSHAFSAMFSCDVGRWLTRIGRFSL